MIKYLIIYLIGCVISYLVCKIARYKSIEDANQEIDKDITTILVALSWVSNIFFLVIFIKMIRENYKDEKI